MDLATIFQQLGIALGLGLLVGMQRERTAARLAGFRTFPLITILGSLCTLLSKTLGGWIVVAGLAALALIIVVGNVPNWKSDEEAPGVTTEVAMLLMFVVGGALMTGFTSVAIAVAGTVAVLLHLKPQMHALAARIGENDFKAMMQFVLVTMVVLPVLPNSFYGPFQVLNPFKIWLMVVLIVGISLGGYVIFKYVSPKAGVWAGGVLGGLISSTATTVSYARRTRQAPESAPLAAFVVLVASTVVFLRVMILIGTMAPQFLSSAGAPILIMFVAMTAVAFWQWRGNVADPKLILEPGNPSELKAALFFAVLYAGVLLAAAAARDYFGQGGLYLVAVLSGLTDMDAITLSIAQMVGSQKITPDTGWRCILVASLANLVFKAAILALVGNRRLFRRVAGSFGAIFVLGILLLVWF